jgi:hypothetical protein
LSTSFSLSSRIPLSCSSLSFIYIHLNMWDINQSLSLSLLGRTDDSTRAEKQKISFPLSLSLYAPFYYNIKKTYKVRVKNQRTNLFLSCNHASFFISFHFLTFTSGRSFCWFRLQIVPKLWKSYHDRFALIGFLFIRAAASLPPTI